MKKLNRVIIVGRTNIGKSTLFNRLSSTVKSLIFDEEGVTRDYIKDVVQWKGHDFELFDSAGLSFKKNDDPIQEKMRLSALSFFESSNLILFVVDGVVSMLPEDHDIAKAIHKSGKKTVLVINKMDVKVAQEQVHDFDRLGFKKIVPISAQHGKGIGELLDAIVEELAQVGGTIELQEPGCSVVLLGKPNVGKSSLMNALLEQERSLVTDIPGTTREAIHEKIQFYKETIELVDTPGVRRPRSIEQELEGMMVKSALRAVRSSNIVLLLVDASSGMLSDQELKLAYYAFEDQKKALIILFNKQDLMDEQIKKDLEFNLERYEHLLDKIITLSISVKTGKNIGKILPTVHEVWQRYSHQFQQEELVVLFKQALMRTPLYRAGAPLRFYSARQIKTAPITIMLYVEKPQWFESSQLGFFENVLRSHRNLRGVPIHFVVRKASK